MEGKGLICVIGLGHIQNGKTGAQRHAALVKIDVSARNTRQVYHFVSRKFTEVVVVSQSVQSIFQIAVVIGEKRSDTALSNRRIQCH